MSEQFDNNLRGVLFNNNKRKSDASPDMNGHLEIEGVEYWVSAWWQQPKNGGDDFLSFRINPKEDNEPAPAPKQSARQTRQPARAPARSPSRGRSRQVTDNDIPF